MPKIDINLGDTPDEMPKVAPGIHIFDIKDVKEDKTQKDEDRITIEMEVNDPADPEHGKKIWDQFILKHMPARVKFKRLVKAAGLDVTGTGIDSTDLIGATVKATVKPRTYKDRDTDEMKETNNVSDYLFEAATA